jgi:PKD repeat protein
MIRRNNLIIFLMLLFITAAYANLSQQEARDIALQEIKNISALTTSGNWSSQTLISDAYPVYIDGISAISYYECKATTNGADAGYVLVNVNQTDIAVVESRAVGKTVREQYRTILGHDNFKVCRYDILRTAALNAANNAILSTKGFNVSGTVLSVSINQYRALAQQKGCNPAYNISDLQNYYNSGAVGLAKSATTATVTNLTELQNSFSYWGTHTPPWEQYQKADGYSVGCGPVAWGIVYAYWKQFKGKEKLFPGLTSVNGVYETNAIVKNCIDHVSSDVGTFNVSGTNQAATIPTYMPNGQYYGINLGYDCSSKYHSGEDYDIIRNNIANDKPVILFIASGNTWILPDHFVVAEKAIKYTKQIIGISYTSSIRYYCNFGWGVGDYKWIYGWDCSFSSNDICGSITLDIGVEKKVQFYAEVLKGKAPLTVKFILVDARNEITMLASKWDFGDGSPYGYTCGYTGEYVDASKGWNQFIIHTYEKPGLYTVNMCAGPRTFGWYYFETKQDYIRVIGKDISPIIQLLLE